MSEETPSGLTPRDRAGEEKARSRRRRRNVAIGVVVALVAAVGIGQLAFGLVSRAIDATGWTCGSGWSRIDDGDLADMRIVRWGTPEAREQGFEPDEFTDLPPGLAAPSLTTYADPPASGYDPSLYPLDGGVVVQASGYYDKSWVIADAQTGDPLWGVESGTSGFSTVQGFGLVSAREDGRTDLTTFDPRTGDELSCVRLDGKVLHLDGIGEDLVVALSIEGGDDTSYRMVRLDPSTGKVAWDQPLGVHPATVHTAGGEIVISSRQVGAIATSWGGGAPSSVVVLDPETGEQLREHDVPGGELAVVGTTALPDGGSGTLALSIPDREAWSDAIGEYVLIDDQGEELWRTVANFGRDDLAFWSAGDVLVVLEGYQPVGIDIRTGERLWQAEGAGMEDDIGVLDSGGGPVLVLSGQREESGDFVTHLIDPRTGEVTVVDAPLHSFRLTDSYVLSTTARTQIVILLDS